jgi:hypothetical protein
MRIHIFADLPRSIFPALLLFAPACALAACGGGGGGAGGGTTTHATTIVTLPTVHQCTGSANPCQGRSSVQCDGHFGCAMLGTCDGTATPCIEILDQVQCELQQGCFWGAGSCFGSESACSQIGGSIGCGNQQGCMWVPGCIGTAWTCDTFSDATQCAEQPGCLWQ